MNRLASVVFKDENTERYPRQGRTMNPLAALPTAQSCYVMTATMRGDAASVAGVTTAQTLAAMATLPVWTALIQSLT